MLSVELTAQDLGRIRFADAPAPVLETVLILFELRQKPRPPSSSRALDGNGQAWREAALATVMSQARALLPLIPSRQRAIYLDVLTPDAEQAFELVRNTPRSVHQKNLDRFDAVNVGKNPTWLYHYFACDPAVLDPLDSALRSFHAACLAPRWTTVTARFHHDLVTRTTLQRRHGVIAMLNTLSPHLTLRGLTLEGRYPWQRRVQLHGQGLILMPSSFWSGHPLITWDPQESSRYVLIYPALPLPGREHRRIGDTSMNRSTHDPLEALLGPTRAAVLRALHRPHTTTTLAREVVISPAAASTHTATLRAAGLITSERRGQAVVHQLTELGSALLWQDY
jgi:DNA-binding transcriptional ArsR family regulator